MPQTRDPRLLTPGPLTTSAATKEVMLHDWGSRDAVFIETNKRVRARLLEIAGVADTHVCVPMQGSGTFVVEATLGTLVPRGGKALIVINGAYGTRMTHMLEKMGRAYTTYETAEDVPPDAAEVDRILADDQDITHVAMIHCETTAGILNPVDSIAQVAARHKRGFIIDAMSAFGAIPLDPKETPYDAVVFSANKCFEGVPGLGFAIVRKSALEAAAGNAHSLSLDLFDQWSALEKTGQYRFTPPVHVICAFEKALEQFDAEGGVAGRNKRYAGNCRILLDGLRAMGFETLLSDNLQAPIIVSVHMPADPKFKFETFYDAMQKKGYVLYPGKLTIADTFRVGCIGALDEADMRGAVDAMRQTLKKMGVANGAPPSSVRAKSA
ncbi:MAG: 2-aminoethylphosphonate--pyruvate transaminase [Rhodospirillales bacterium]